MTNDETATNNQQQHRSTLDHQLMQPTSYNTAMSSCRNKQRAKPTVRMLF